MFNYNFVFIFISQTDPLSQHLFALEPKRWRPLRTRLSPVFTSGKLKEMFSLISQCADHLERYMETLASNGEPVECCEVMAKYTTEVIGSCAFGIEMNALSDDESEFRKMGRKIFTPSRLRLLRFRLSRYMPWLYDKLKYILPNLDVATFFTRIVMETMNYRETNNLVRDDFIDVLRELKRHPDTVDNIGT